MIGNERVLSAWRLGILGPLLLLATRDGMASAAQMFVDAQFGVSVTSNIQYASHPVSGGGNLNLSLDLYRPTGIGLPAQLPAMVLMHGGYYVGGSKNDSDMVALAQEFATRGWVTASINYRMLGNLPPSPGATLAPHLDRLPSWLPGQLTAWNATLPQYMDTIAAATYDEATAVNWLVSNAATYNIDPELLAAGGYSAGAVSSLALGAGVVDGVPDTGIKAVFSLAGALFGWESAIDSNMPGVFILHGTEDTTVPYSEVPYLQAALSGAGVPYDSLIVPGADHTSPQLGSEFFANEQQFFQFMADQILAVPEPSSQMLASLAIISVIGYGVTRRCRTRDGWRCIG